MSLGHVLHESVWYRISQFPELKVLVVTRSPVAFTSREDINRACDPVQATLDRAGRESHSVIIDTRLAVGNNDPAFEGWFAAHRRRMLEGFLGAALVVATPVGRLHVQRLLRADGNGHIGACTTVEEAVAFLAKKRR